MFETSGDILNISLAIGFFILLIFLSILVFYGIMVLRDVSKVADRIEQLVARVHTTVEQPLKAMDYVVDKTRPYLEMVVQKVIDKMNKKK